MIMRKISMLLQSISECIDIDSQIKYGPAYKVFAVKTSSYSINSVRYRK